MIYFLHGKNKTPNDKKLQALKKVAEQKGFECKMFDDSDTKESSVRAKRTLKRLKDEKDIIIVGSSMGGYCGVYLSSYVEVRGMFLLAPALYLSHYEKIENPIKCKHICIVHGSKDEVVPPKNSIQFAKENKSPLYMVDDTHSLNNSQESLNSIFSDFLDSLTY